MAFSRFGDRKRQAASSLALLSAKFFLTELPPCLDLKFFRIFSDNFISRILCQTVVWGKPSFFIMELILAPLRRSFFISCMILGPCLTQIIMSQLELISNY